MSRNTSFVISIIALLLVLGGIYYFATRSPSLYTDVSTPTNDVPSNNTAGAPAVATKLASFISQSTAVLNGEVNPNGVQTSYWYEYGETDTLGSFTSPQLVGGGQVTYGAPGAVVGLKANTFYYFRLTAQNQYGKAYGEVLSFKTTTTPPPRYFPPSVQTKDASALLASSATLNGSVNSNGSNTFYWFEYGENFSFGNVTPIVEVKAGSTVMNISAGVTGLKSGATYYYRLNAQNAYGTVNGTILSFTTPPVNPPPPPLGNPPVSVTNSATAVTGVSATLNAQINPSGSATTYYFEYGKSTPFGLFSLDEKTDTKSAGSGTVLARFSADVTGLDEGSTYYFRLISQNQYGITRGSVFSFTTRNQ